MWCKQLSPAIPRRRQAAGATVADLPKDLPREEIVIEPESKACPCCGGATHVIGEDVAEMSISFRPSSG